MFAGLSGLPGIAIHAEANKSIPFTHWTQSGRGEISLVPVLQQSVSHYHAEGRFLVLTASDLPLQPGSGIEQGSYNQLY